MIWRGSQVLRNPSNAELARSGRPAPRRAARGGATSSSSAPARPGWPPPSTAPPRAWPPSRWTPSPPAARPGRSSRIENYLGFPSGISGAELADRARHPGATSSAPGSACRPRRSALEPARRLPPRPAGRRHDGRRAGGADRDRRPLPPARRAAALEHSRGPASTTRRPGRGADVPRRPGRRRRRRQLGRAGGAVPRRARAGGAAADPRRRPGRGHVALPGRPDRAPPQVEVLPHTEVRELRRRRHPRGGRGRGQPRPASAAASTSGAVRLHRRRAAHPVAGRPASRSTPRVRPHRSRCGRSPTANGSTVDRPPLPLETSRPGVFAVGDVRSGSIKRVASAVGEGAMAVRLVHERLAGDWRPGLATAEAGPSRRPAHPSTTPAPMTAIRMAASFRLGGVQRSHLGRPRYPSPRRPTGRRDGSLTAGPPGYSSAPSAWVARGGDPR